MKWTIHIVKQAQKIFRRMPKKDREYVAGAIKEMSGNPWGGDTDWLKDQPATFRRRVGNWRILFDIHIKNHLVVVVDIKRRDSKTYK